MATSTLVQNLSGTGVVSNRRQTETFLATVAIVAGDIGKIAMIDAGQTGSDKLLYVRVATAVAGGNGKAVGVIQNAAAAGGKVELVVAGYAATVQSTGSVTSGHILTASPASHAGKVLQAIASDTARPFGVAITTATSPACWIYPQF